MRLSIFALLCLPPLAAAGCAAQTPHASTPGAVVSGNPDMTEFVRDVDVNGDGKMSRAEWQAQGLPASSFNMFEKGRGYVTLEDYQVHAAPPGIDLNGDGKLTVAEFKEFDRKMPAGRPGPSSGAKP